MGVRITGVTFAYGALPLYKNLSLTLPDNGIFALTGASGCGKTTLLRLIAGLEKPQSGSVEVDGRISTVFQEDRLLPWMTALENVDAVSDTETAKHWLDAVGLGGEHHRFPRELSGGMCRRVAIARALAYDGEVLLLDEPFNGIDRETAQKIAAYLSAVRETRLILLVTHDPALLELCGATPVAVENLVCPH